ncbi:MAG: S1C family serine protease, partial [Patescibacteria group bacterium]
MEELTRTQTVLLCVLVSFVTSIGTGIITVSLLQEAPPGVTQTINQVVERTVERVVPGPSRETVKEVTVVVKEEDLVIDSIKKNEKSLVRIAQASGGTGSSGAQNTVALGLVVSTNGNILVDRRAITDGSSFVATFHDGRQFPVKLVSSSLPSASNFAGNIPNSAYLETIRENKDADYAFFPAVTASSDTLQLGQTIIALGGKAQSQVAIGRVSFLNFSDTSVATSSKSVVIIQT